MPEVSEGRELGKEGEQGPAPQQEVLPHSQPENSERITHQSPTLRLQVGHLRNRFSCLCSVRGTFELGGMIAPIENDGPRSVLGEPLQPCCTRLNTGWFRNGSCETHRETVGVTSFAP